MGKSLNNNDEIIVNGKIRRQQSNGQESDKDLKKKAGKKRPNLFLSFDDIPI